MTKHNKQNFRFLVDRCHELEIKALRMEARALRGELSFWHRFKEYFCINSLGKE